ncbi:hypothetical protein PTTG_26344 [Puccinia triticina 1-1 BBBD Race 1]|uniref:Uncharacterized protein n=1 Tax=Puccinia triticina (isolate 1-1 / race 1 (BBBD)) TaxID=630390 RepID=A0A180GUU4_PUCT1|nr:hypothetical protein PTTG_26344 [Puccinia triticina 1-1 BBBD Race 1]
MVLSRTHYILIMDHAEPDTQTTAEEHGQQLSTLLSALAPIPSHQHPHKRPKLTSQHNSAPSQPPTEAAAQPTFAQALPALQKIIQRPGLLDKIQQIKEDQDQFELRAIDQRNQIQAELDRTIKKLSKTSPADSSNRVKHEAQIEKLKAETKSKLGVLDRSLLSRWDQLKLSQLLALKNLNVPTFDDQSENQLAPDHHKIHQQQLVIDFLIKAVNDRPSE